MKVDVLENVDVMKHSAFANESSKAISRVDTEMNSDVSETASASIISD
jgi:hypothetical protein